ENFLADLLPLQHQHPQTQVAALVHQHQFGMKTPIEADLHWPYSIYRAPCYGRLLYAPLSPHFPLWLKKIIKQFQPDILHFHVPNTSAFWALSLPTARQIPWVIHWHADVVSQVNRGLSIAYPFYRPFEQRLLAHAQAIIATSEPYLNSSVALRPWQHKCHIVPLGLALQRLPMPSTAAQSWAEQHWQPQKMRLLSIGRLTYYKGHEILLHALAALPQVQLVIVGQGELKTRLHTLINTLKLTDRVKLFGFCTNEDLIALLNSCDCFCLPSLERTEAFGVALLEAMRYRKAVIASAITGSGITWVVQDQHTGLLVPPQDIHALRQAIQQLCEQPLYRQQLGTAGYQRFTTLFDIQAVAERLMPVYQQLLANKLNKKN
ncbi:MAG: glycosyltransferase, partial [Pseudomonadota bacterium]|nr:glycosyltransferase [Pseudomonadota bacterium]